MPEWTTASVERALRSRVSGGADWLATLDDLEAEIIRLRASGARWKQICWQLGMGRATAHRRFKAALHRIADRLNQEAVRR